MFTVNLKYERGAVLPAPAAPEISAQSRQQQKQEASSSTPAYIWDKAAAMIKASQYSWRMNSIIHYYTLTKYRP